MLWIILIEIYLHTKFQVSSFSRSWDIERGVPKIFKWVTGPRPLLSPNCKLLCNISPAWYFCEVSWWSFIGCQDICENALHGLMLEVLPKKRFWGISGGGGWPLKQNDTLGIYLPPKRVLRCIERQAPFYGLLCTRSQGTKNLKNHLFGIWEVTAQCDAWFSTLYKYSYLLTYLLKKVRDVATSPLPPPYISKVACLNFGMWGRVLDIINRAKF